MVIALNGTFVGEPGYPRGNVKRSEPGFGDPAMSHLITGKPTDPMCKDSQKSPSSQSASSPRLKAAPGAYIALRFQENGHVTLPETQAGKPENRGDVFVYGTTQPKDDELFTDVHGVWTADGQGGDGRGILLAKAAYDDGQCYQINGGAISTNRQKQFAHPSNQLMGADLWCQTDVRLPSDAPSGQRYTLYWVWEWPTAPGVDPGLPVGKNETYTTCMDVDTTAASNFSQKVASEGFVQGQPIENAAIPAQLEKLDVQAPASAPATSASVAPSLETPFPTSIISPGSNLTTISPISEPRASSTRAQSDLASSATILATSTTAQGLPPTSVTLSAPFTLTRLDSPSVTPSMLTVIKTDRVTVTDYVTVQVTAVPTSRAAPKIRGRIPI